MTDINMLPPELIVHISEYAQKDDFISLKNTCSSFRNTLTTKYCNKRWTIKHPTYTSCMTTHFIVIILCVVPIICASIITIGLVMMTIGPSDQTNIVVCSVLGAVIFAMTTYVLLIILYRCCTSDFYKKHYETGQKV